MNAAALGLIGRLVLAGTLINTSVMCESALSVENLVYIGTYTGAGSQGIYVARFDPCSGKLGQPELAAETKNPGFLAVHPNRRCLYAVGEIGTFRGQPTGAVSAFKIDPGTGKLTLLNQQPSGGAGPCHVSVDRAGACVLVANYGSGSVAALPIRPDGSLAEPATVIQHRGSSVNPQRQAGPHAHFILPDPANRFVAACDLGLDQVLIYKFDPAKASLTPNAPAFASVPPGAGPRHLAFSPDGKFAWVVNEMASSVSAFAYDAAKGAFKLLETQPALPGDFKSESSGAEIQVHPSGKFLYSSNRGHDSLCLFGIDTATGRLRILGHEPVLGKTPRHFAFDPTGDWLFVENQDSNSISIFRVDGATGQLTPTGQKVEVARPVCVVFVSLS